MKRKEMQSLAMEAARLSLADKTSIQDIADKMGISRSSISVARLILEFGSSSDIDAASSGRIGLRTLASRIRMLIPQPQRDELKTRTGVWTDSRREKLGEEAILWGKLGPALRGLTELPRPYDMIEVITRNAMREDATNQHLEIAAKWMEEFTNEWRKYRQGKSTGDLVDTGGSNPIAGTQHTEQAA